MQLTKIKISVLVIGFIINSIGLLINGLWLNFVGMVWLFLLVLSVIGSTSRRPFNKKTKSLCKDIEKNQSSSYRKPAIDRMLENKEDTHQFKFINPLNQTANKKNQPTYPAKVGAATKCPNCGFYGPNLKNQGCNYPNICEGTKWKPKHQHIHQSCMNCLSNWIRIKGPNDECYF